MDWLLKKKKKKHLYSILQTLRTSAYILLCYAPGEVEMERPFPSCRDKIQSLSSK